MSRWPYNTARWEKLRRLQLSSQPLCAYCEEIGAVTPATVVDHITPVKQDAGKAFEPLNLQSLCKPCHDSVKQREEITGRRIGADVNGLPLDPGHPWRQ